MLKRQPLAWNIGSVHKSFSRWLNDQLTGMARQTAYRALHGLEKAGLIRVDYGSVEVLDLEGLKKFALGA